MKKFQIIIAALLLCGLLVGCDSQSTESKADISVNTEVSTGDVSNEVSDEVSEDISDIVSDTDISKDEVSEPEESVPDVHTHKYAGAWKSNGTDHWKECDCGEKTDIASHDYGDWTVTKEATEQAEGSKHHSCKTCGYKETAVIPVLSHTHSFGEWKTNATSHWKECKCGEKSNLSTHTYGSWTIIKEATCTTEGSKNHTCTACGYNEIASIPANGHSYGDWKSNGTDHWKECDCGNKSDVAGHTYGEWTVTKEATEEVEGSKYHSCKTCGYKETTVIPVLSHTHSFGEWVRNATSHWKECRCGDKTDLSNHDFIEWIVTKEATCTTEGSRMRGCNNCNHVEVETLPVTAHSYGTWKTNGTDHWKECECGKKADLASHNFGDWTVTKECDCTTDGEKNRTCTTCSYNETETIHSLGHIDVIDHAVAATCTTTGKTEGKHCFVCNKVLIKQNIIQPSHTWETEYLSDKESHWQICSLCQTISEKQTHTANHDGFCSTCLLPIKPTDGVLYFTSADGTYAEVVDYTGTAKIVIIASQYEGLPVKHIGDSAFRNKSVTSVYIPDSVTSIGNGAFYGCSSLKSVTIPNSVTSIDNLAFCGCWSLTGLRIPDSVTSIGDSAFYNCLKLIQYENGVSYVDNCAVYFDDSVAVLTLRPNTRLIANDVFSYINSSKLRSIVIPDSVKSIGERAFYSCTSLTSVTIGNGVTSIGDNAFYRCTSLTSMTIGNRLTNIGDSAFYGCTSLTSVTIPDSVTTGNGVTSIGDSAFYKCTALTNVTIGNGITSIGDSAFYKCTALTNVTIPNSVTSIGNHAFYYCTSLTSVTMGNRVASIGDSAFYGCTSLTSVTIPNSVTTIGDHAFFDCTALTSVTIPNSVTSIEFAAFLGCGKLTIYCEAKEKPSGWKKDWKGVNTVIWGYTG